MTSTEARFTARERRILVLLCGAQFMLALDFSILSVALPAIGSELGLSIGDLQWIVTAYALPAGGFLLLFGRTADLFGRRRLFMIGMGVFTVASLVAGLATTAELLLAGRVGQGFGAAAVTPAAMSLLTTSFAEGPRRNRAIGINGTLLSLGFLSGVVLGGVITQLIDWRVGLLVNVPLGVAAMLAAPRLLQESSLPASPRLDVPGAITGTAGLLGIIYGFTSAEREGWVHPVTLVALLGGVALLVVFVAIQARRRDPLVQLSVLGRRNVGLGNVVGLITFSMTTALVFLITLYLQRVRGFSPLETGLCFAALGGAAVLGGAVAAKVVGSLGMHRAMLLGFTLQAAGTGVLFFVGRSEGLPLLLVATAVLGFGHLLAVVTYMITATSGLPDSEQGLATGLAYTAQQVGVAVGTPI
ncbi:MAG: MFS transporter, partial [Thermocrispum sp.]